MTDKAKKILLLTIAGVLFGAGVFIPVWMIATRPEPRQMSAPLPLGTNQLKIGAKLYNRHSATNQLLFVVVELDPAHEFPDGETLPAARVKSPTIGSSSWVAREKMNDFLVVQ